MGHSTQPVVSWDIALVKYANVPWNLWDIMGYMTLFADADCYIPRDEEA